MIESIEQEIRILRTTFWSGRDPEGRAFVPLADAYRRAGNFRQAVELLTEGLERHPGFTSAHLVAAQLYHEKGLAEEAELAFRRVLELDPDNVVALALLAETLRERGQVAEASGLRTRHSQLEGAPGEPAEGPEPAHEEEAEPIGLAPADEPVAVEAPITGEVAETGAVTEPVEEEAPEVELATELAYLEVPDEAETMDGPAVEVAELAPEPEPEPFLEVAEPAPEPEPFVEVAELAPEPEPEPEPFVEVAELAPEPFVEVAELAPEPFVEVAELAPEPFVEVAELAPEPFVEVAELAPEPEPVVDVSALAPDESGSETDLLLDEVDDQPMVTRTMAELFASQGLVDRALEVFRQLLEMTPGDAGLRQRIAELSARLEGSQASDREVQPSVGAPAGASGSEGPVQDDDDLSGHVWDADAQADRHDVDTPFAWTQQDPDEASAVGPPISTYFSRMLGWEPGAPASPERLDGEADPAGGDDPTKWLNREGR